MRGDAELVDTQELLDAPGIGRALRRMAHEIVERNAAHIVSGHRIVLVGIHSAGVPLAQRLAHELATTGELPAAQLQLGAIDITLYRDDVFEGLPRPVVGATELPHHSVDGCVIILVDDVLYTGRTIRAALDALMDFGRPRAVQLAVLVDRGHRELPVQPDYAGLVVQTRRDQSVKVTLKELGADVDRASLREKKS